MKLKVPQPVFLDGLSAIQNAVSSRPTNPILTNALIVAGDGTITMTATDIDMTIQCTIAADVAKPGSTTLPAKRLAGVVGKLTGGTIEMVVDDKNVTGMRCGSANFKLNGMPASEFPPVPSTEGSTKYNLDKAVFANMLKKTHYAASKDDSRPALNGVLLNFKDSKLTCVATDGRRLALIEHEVEFPADHNRDVILPKRAVGELIRILEKQGEGNLGIYLKGNQAIFEFDSVVMYCKLVDGVYPNFRQVILSQCDHRITISREELLGALGRVSEVTTEKSNAMRLTFEDNKLSIVASSPDVGAAEDELAVKYNGPKITAIFNPEFMSDPLRHLTSDEIYMELNDAMSPGLIKSDIPFLYVLMPLRI